MFIYKFSYGHSVYFLLGVYLVMEWLGHMVTIWETVWETARLFSRAATPFYHQQRVSPSPIPPAPTIIHVNCVFFFYYRHLSGCSDTWWFWISPCAYWTYALFWKQIILGCFITVFLYCYPELLGADLTFFFFVMILTRAQCLSVSLSASWKCL